MAPASFPALAAAESRRWSRDSLVLALVLIAAFAAAILTYFALLVSAGVIESSGGGVQIETDTYLGAASSDEDVASMLHSSLVLLLPIAAVVIGARLAGNEMSSGALLTIASSARRLRVLFSARVVVLAVALTATAVVTVLLVCAAGNVALASANDLGHLSATAFLGPLALGAITQTLTFGLLTFALSALTRRWVPVVIGAIVYIVALEPVIQGLAGGAADWLPRSATSGLVAVEPDWAPVVPTIVVTLALLVWVIVTLRRDRAFR